MLDRKQFDLEMDLVQKEEIKHISEYLDKFIQLNADMRHQKLNGLGHGEDIKYIESVDIPKHGRNFREVADEAVNHIFKNQALLQHPRYLSLVCTSVSPYSLMGAILSDIYNINVAGFQLAPAANIVEEKLIAYMAKRVGFDPKKATGVFTSGGSLSNLTGMIAARENKLRGNRDLPIAVAYTSDQAHTSVKKAMRMMGLRPEQIRILQTNDKFEIEPSELEAMIKDDIKKGQRPFLIAATCGTTNTGSIDPIPELAKIAKKYDIWLHVDGAYGGSIFFSEIYKNLGKGIEEADSFSWDTHKWALQGYSSSVVLAKDKSKWIDAFIEHPEYLADVQVSDHFDGWDRGIEMSRPFRAIKLWFTLQCLGTEKLADVIDYSFFNAKVMLEELGKHEYWEIMAPSKCAAVNFRLAPKNINPKYYDEMTHLLSERINEDGYAYILTTTLKGNTCCRVCLINGNTTTEDIINTVEKLDEIATGIIKEFEGK